jgi:UDP-N-acetylglucosamine transferase subunit ALG13
LIFANVGSQLPFDRMLKALNAWAQVQSNAVSIRAQIGNTSYLPTHLDFVATMPPSEFRNLVRNAEMIVAHAGMGSVLTALEFGKPLVIMPRLCALHETRNDHQVATANWLASKAGIFVAMKETDLASTIDRARAQALVPSLISTVAAPELIGAIKSFIHL